MLADCSVGGYWFHCIWHDEVLASCSSQTEVSINICCIKRSRWNPEPLIYTYLNILRLSISLRNCSHSNNCEKWKWYFQFILPFNSFSFYFGWLVKFLRILVWNDSGMIYRSMEYAKMEICAGACCRVLFDLTSAEEMVIVT